MKNVHPLNKIKLAGTIIGFVIVTLVIGIKDPGQVRANTNDNVHGYLFSDMPTASDQTQTPTNTYGGQGLGYVSLNNVAPDPVLPGTYGVSFDFQTGKFSGYGWSEYGNYVDFAPTASTPSGSGTNAGPAYIDTACLATAGPCSVRGWIRFTQAGMNFLGGWDGWVSLHGTAANGSVYGVMYNPTNGQLSGKAWGSDVVGWLDFSNAKIDMVPTGMTCQDANGNVYSWTPPAQPPIQCAPTQTCFDQNGNPHTYALGSPMPAICIGFGQICFDDQGVAHTYPQGAPMPAVCQALSDYCNLVPGDQTQADLAFPGLSYNNTWYGLASNICKPDQCKDTSDPETYGFQAYVPFTGSNGESYNIDPTDGVCKKQTVIPPCTDPAICPKLPLKPIYKEN
jgi:hypothetical protein